MTTHDQTKGERTIRDTGSNGAYSYQQAQRKADREQPRETTNLHPGPDMDATVGRIMGVEPQIKWDPVLRCEYRHYKPYSTDMNAALEALLWMNTRPGSHPIYILAPRGKEWSVCAVVQPLATRESIFDRPIYLVQEPCIALTAPEAICRAVLAQGAKP